MSKEIQSLTGAAKLQTALEEAFAPLTAQFEEQERKAQKFFEISNKEDKAAQLEAKKMQKESLALRKEVILQHKELKSGVLDIGRKIDSKKKTIINGCNEIEGSLKEFSEYEKRQAIEKARIEAEKVAKLQAQRDALLSKYQDPDGLSLGDMPAEQFELILEGAKARFEKQERERLEAAQAVEKARIETAKRQQLEAAQNAIILQAEKDKEAKEQAQAQAEKAKADAAKAIERQRIEAERYAEQEKARKIEKWVSFLNELELVLGAKAKERFGEAFKALESKDKKKKLFEETKEIIKETRAKASLEAKAHKEQAQERARLEAAAKAKQAQLEAAGDKAKIADWVKRLRGVYQDAPKVESPQAVGLIRQIQAGIAQLLS